MTIKHCCCCFDLRTGNIIIAWLDVLSVFAIFSTSNAQSCVIPFIIGLFSLYAIYKERSEFLWPSMIVRALLICYLILSLILFFAGSAFLMIKDTEHEHTDKKVEVLLNVLIVSEILAAIMLVVTSYFFYVILSLFKQMKAEESEKVRVAQFDNIERGLYPKLCEKK